MDRQAKILRERLFYWSYVVGGALPISMGSLFLVHRYASTDAPQVDHDAVAAMQVLVGFGMILMLGAVIHRRRSKKSWIVPGLFLAWGSFRLIWLQWLVP